MDNVRIFDQIKRFLLYVLVSSLLDEYNFNFDEEKTISLSWIIGAKFDRLLTNET